MKLLVQRHGFAGNKIKDDDQQDLDRDITDEGETHARAVAKHLVDNDMAPDAIFSSPTKRALQTAHVMAEHIFGDPDKVTVDQNLAEGKPLEMAVVARTQDENVKRPLLVTHSGNIDRLHHLKGKYGKKIKSDPMATSEVREIKIKRGDVEPGGPGQLPSARWKETNRVTPNDADHDLENLY